MKDLFGDRCKGYEKREDSRFMSLLPVIVRLDGKGFSKWTKGLHRPFDSRLSTLMIATTKRLVQETGALIGYTQSDEISLVLYSDSTKTLLYCDGRRQKIVSHTASLATEFFNRSVRRSIPEKEEYPALFDSRAWVVPTKEEAANAILWREQDATKNSVSMAARAYYSHKELLGKSSSEMQDMLHAKGVNWNYYPAFFKRGTFVARRATQRKFTPEEIESLPAAHAARKDPDLEVVRHAVVELDMPAFSSVTNRVGVIFAEEPPMFLSVKPSTRYVKDTH